MPATAVEGNAANLYSALFMVMNLGRKEEKVAGLASLVELFRQVGQDGCCHSKFGRTVQCICSQPMPGTKNVNSFTI